MAKCLLCDNRCYKTVRQTLLPLTKGFRKPCSVRRTRFTEPCSPSQQGFRNPVLRDNRVWPTLLWLTTGFGKPCYLRHQGFANPVLSGKRVEQTNFCVTKAIPKALATPALSDCFGKHRVYITLFPFTSGFCKPFSVQQQGLGNPVMSDKTVSQTLFYPTPGCRKPCSASHQGFAKPCLCDKTFILAELVSTAGFTEPCSP